MWGCSWPLDDFATFLSSNAMPGKPYNLDPRTAEFIKSGYMAGYGRQQRIFGQSGKELMGSYRRFRISSKGLAYAFLVTLPFSIVLVPAGAFYVLYVVDACITKVRKDEISRSNPNTPQRMAAYRQPAFTPRRPARSWMNCHATRPDREPRVIDHSTASACNACSSIGSLMLAA